MTLKAQYIHSSLEMSVQNVYDVQITNQVYENHEFPWCDWIHDGKKRFEGRLKKSEKTKWHDRVNHVLNIYCENSEDGKKYVLTAIHEFDNFGEAYEYGQDGVVPETHGYSPEYIYKNIVYGGTYDSDVYDKYMSEFGVMILELEEIV